MLEKNTAIFLQFVSTQNYNAAYAMVDKNSKTFLDAQSIEQTWNKIQEEIGKYKNIESIKVYSDTAKKHIVLSVLQFEKSRLAIEFIFSKQTQQVLEWVYLPAPLKDNYVFPLYHEPNSYTTQDCIIKTGKYELPAVLTLPKNTKEKPPLVILVHGSGPHDKDQTIGPTKTFMDLSIGLAKEGIATLRYYKRTFLYANEIVKDIKNLTLQEETIDDAITAIELCRTLNTIDTNRIFLLGHSLGGVAAPRIATQNKHLAGIILFATPVRPLEDIIVSQYEYILGLDGIDANDTVLLNAIKAQVDNVKKLTSPEENLPLPLGLPTKYWFDLKNYDIVKTTQQLTLPICVLQGENDYQVTMQDFEGWKKALVHHKKAHFKSYPMLNHLFIAKKSKSTPKDYEEQGNVAYPVIQDIAKWVKK
jgi:dienelactone hydrolase